MHRVLNEGSVVDADLCYSAAISVRNHLAGAVTTTHPYALGQDLLQLRCRSASYQRPYQCQGVVVEVRLSTHKANTYTL